MNCKENPQPTKSSRDKQEKAAGCSAPDTKSPADRYQELFIAVQSGGVFPDSKTFVDCAPRFEPQTIVANYRAQYADAGFSLVRFVHEHFKSIQPAPSDYKSIPGQALGSHIESLWPTLTRHPAQHPQRSSLLQLPHPYIVPGGRFGELYYWDSYFTMLGLNSTKHAALLQHMVENFAYLIDTYGHVPNGTRSYYLSRSQPPVFALMIELAEATCGEQAMQYLPQLQQEHDWWMTDAHKAAAGGAHRRVVRLKDGGLLNRYWDDRDTPREESWLEDVTTARESQRDATDIYRHLRAACESGWDFSSRWLAELGGPTPKRPSLSTICTTDIVPVDLNAFLYKLEMKIAELSTLSGADDRGLEFQERARARKAAMLELMWNPEQGAFFDHDWRLSKQRTCLTAATVVPLFVGLADPDHAKALAATIERRLLGHGGLATSEEISAQQWDCPNGWAPLQWMAIRGLADYGHDELSQTIARRWLATVAAIYERDGKLIEKYGLRQVEQDATQAGGGGEYPLQDGFGWTNGVTAALLVDQPNHSAHTAVALGKNCRHP
jgi:alpha,alpha-trehalase